MPEAWSDSSDSIRVRRLPIGIALTSQVVTLTKAVNYGSSFKQVLQDPSDNHARASRALRMVIEPLPKLLETTERYLNQSILSGLGS